MNIKHFLSRKKINSKIIFMHLPKCGGTSMKKSIVAHYKEHRCTELSSHKSKKIYDEYKGKGESLQKLRVKMIHYFALSGDYDFVTGHFHFDKKMYDNTTHDYDFVTVLRDPVKRYISHYFYNRYKESLHYKIDVDIETFLDSQSGHDLGEIYLRSFTGPFQKTTVENAVENARLFDMIGTLDKLEAFRQAFADRYGVTLDIDHENSNPLSKKDQSRILSDTTLYKIEEICKKDIAFFKALQLDQ